LPFVKSDVPRNAKKTGMRRKKPRELEFTLSGHETIISEKERDRLKYCSAPAFAFLFALNNPVFRGFFAGVVFCVFLRFLSVGFRQLQHKLSNFLEI